MVLPTQGVNGVHSRGAVEGQQTQAQQMMQRDAWDQDLLDTHEQVDIAELCIVCCWKYNVWTV